MNGISINGSMTVEGPIIANGPVFVQGVDIKAGLDRLRRDLNDIDQKNEARIEAVLGFVNENFELKPEERTKIQNTIKILGAGLDHVGRIQTIQMLITDVGPLLGANIAILIKYAHLIKFVVDVVI